MNLDSWSDIYEQTVVVGRSPQCSFWIPNDAVSGRHCEISIEGDAILIRDLDSTNGTFVNNHLIESDAALPLNDGDLILVGGVILKFVSIGNLDNACHIERFRCSRFDRLTNLIKAELLEEALEKQIASALHDKARLCVMLIGIGDFAEGHGHMLVDFLFKHVSDTVRSWSKPEYILARYDDDRLVVVIPRPVQSCAVLSSELRDAIRGTPCIWGDHDVELDFSIGVVNAAPPCDEPMPNIHHAYATTPRPGIHHRTAGHEFRDGTDPMPYRIPPDLTERAPLEVATEPVSPTEKPPGGRDAVKQKSRVAETPDSLLKMATELMYRARNMDECVLIGDAQLKHRHMPPTIRQLHLDLVDELEFKATVAERLLQPDDSGHLAVGASALRDQLALTVELGKPVVERMRNVLRKSLRKVLGEASVISQFEGGTFIYLLPANLGKKPSRAVERINDAFLTRIVDSSLVPSTVELCHGFSITRDTLASVDELIFSAHWNAFIKAKDQPLPYPIARPFKNIEAASDSSHEVLASFSANEKILRFLACVAMAAFFNKATAERISSKVGEHIRKLIVKSTAGGNCWQIAQHVFDAARGGDWPVLSPIAEGIFRRIAHGGNFFELSKEMLEIRNKIQHGPIPNPQVTAPRLPQVKELLSALGESLRVLSKYRLVTVIGLEMPEEGSHICVVRDHSGDEQLFSVDRFGWTKGLPTNQTYLFSRDSKDVLRLSPLLVLADCEQCERSELYWPSSFAFEATTSYEGILTGHSMTQKLKTEDLEKVPAALRRRTSKDTIEFEPLDFSGKEGTNVGPMPSQKRDSGRGDRRS